MGPQLAKKSPTFYGTHKFITAFTNHLSISWATSILSNPSPPNCYLKIHFDIILPFLTRSSKWSLSFRFSRPVRNSPVSHTCHMPSRLQSSWFDHPNDIWWGVEIVKKAAHYAVSSISVTLSFVGPKIFLITLFLNTFSLCSFLIVKDHVSHPCKTTGKIIVLYILNLYIFW